jgi:hypothetical protein
VHAHARGVGWIAPGGLIARFGERACVNPNPARSRAVVFEPRKTGKLLTGFNLLLGGGVFEIGERFAIHFFQYFCQGRIQAIAVIPSEIQNWIGELSAIFFVQIADFQEELRHDSVIEPAITRQRNGGVFPKQPARGIREGTIFFGKAGAGQAVDRGLDLFHVALGDNARGLPEFAGLVGINFADDEPLRFFERIDVFVGIGTNGHAVHAKGKHALDGALVHVVPQVGPGIIAVHFRQIIERPTVLLGGSVPIECLEETDREFRRVAVVVPGIPRGGFGSGGSDALHPCVEGRVTGRGHLQIARQSVEQAGHVSSALNV